MNPPVSPPLDVTVVVPVHNAAPTLARCLDSIAAQTRPPKRVVVIDDASIDGSAAIARGHQSRGLEVIVSARNRGPGAARNHGARGATTEWLAFLDADNEWAPGFLEAVSAAAEAHAADFGSAGGTRVLVAPRQRTWQRLLEEPAAAGERSRDFWRIALRFPPALPSSMIVRRELFVRVGGFPADVRTGEDVTLAARLWLHAPHFAFVNRPLYVSMQQRQGITAGNRRYRDLVMLMGRVGAVLLRAIAARKPGTRWFVLAYARMVVGRHALWLRQRLR